MELTWHYAGPPILLRHFLRQAGFSRAQIKHLKYHGGAILVDRRARHTNFLVQPGSEILVRLAPEVPADTVVPQAGPVAVAYEDRDYLVVNTPAGVASIPDAANGATSMANWVKAYLQATPAESTAIHVITRLDRDTSGLMLFAKHSLAHSRMDAQLHSPRLQKTYLAVAANPTPLPPHGWIVLPIARSREFYMRRAIVLGGKRSVTEYWRQAATGSALLARVRLHTGRTHQIRVHFAAVGHPLYGDDLYGGPTGCPRQALHCAELKFWQPFTEQWVTVTAPLPADLQALVDHLGLTQTAASRD